MTIAELLSGLEAVAPRTLAEPWDNVGLLWGDPEAVVERVLTCLTVTSEVADEAIRDRVSLILSHHPVLFRGAKQVRADSAEGAPLWKLAGAGVAVASLHTAWDNAQGGINDILCERLGLAEVRPLRPSPPGVALSKVVVFTPKADHEAVLAAAFAAGAGRIGEYVECSFATPGVGTFYGLETTNPAIGVKGRRESVRERRVEVICPDPTLANVVAAIRAAHSYEEPAIDIYPLKTEPLGPGVGRIGRLGADEPLGAFAARVGRQLGVGAVQWVGRADRVVRSVAVACGAGDDLLDDAARAGAEVLVTGEARFHRAIEAEARGIGLVLAGHYATERPGVEALAEVLTRRFPGLAVAASRSERDPLRWTDSGTPPPPAQEKPPG